MSTTNTAAVARTRRKKLLNPKVIFIFLFIAIGASAIFYYMRSKASTNGVTQQRTDIARRGDLKVTISGSGTLASSNTLTALSSIEGTISKIYFSGYLDDTMIGSAEINISGKIVKSIGSAKLSYEESISVKAEIGGTLGSFNTVLGQYVNKGDILADITNDDLSIELENSALNIQEMENQLEYSYNKLSHYKIYSTISGTLSFEKFNKGDAVKSGQTVFKVSNYDLMEFLIPVDELDIAKIQTDQAVNITVDALPETAEKPLKGIVAEIAQEGTSSNGVAVYPVTVRLSEPNSGLKVGMNVNGEITVNEKKDALYIPIEAVQKRGNTNIVYVRSNDTSAEGAPRQAPGTSQQGDDRQNAATQQDQTWRQNPMGQQDPSGQTNQTRQQNSSGQQNSAGQENRTRQQASGTNQNLGFRNRVQGDGYYAGAVAKTVEVGINNDEYIEILSGLNQRDIVILPQVSTGSNSANTQNRGFFNGGGMTGGMPIRVTQVRER